MRMGEFIYSLARTWERKILSFSVLPTVVLTFLETDEIKDRDL